MRVGLECDMRDVWMKQGVNKGMLNIGRVGYWSWYSDIEERTRVLWFKGKGGFCVCCTVEMGMKL
ncbi:hypothetical protein, partial [Bacillus pumilus]|uniref:hypothetical protein n=1 Tax=Bacillus pumilus TaxID=1408 RepID=UPI001C92CE66